MRRSLAAVIVLALVIAPSLHLWCEDSCGVSTSASAAPACHHHEAAPGPSIRATHDCDGHGEAPAVVAKAATKLTAPAPFRNTRFDLASLDLVSVTRDVVHALPDSSPPAFVAPLRV